MITLKTLSAATAQQVFDQVVTHLLTQMKKSKDELSLTNWGCRYRYGDLKCAAGCLIGDDEYKPTFEGQGWTYLEGIRVVPSDHRGLIKDLQLIHDQRPPYDWKKALREEAIIRDLEWNHG